MASYPTGGPSHYYGNNPQDETFHEPPQFYNPHDTYDQSGYREPEQYQDEPSYTLPQGQSTEPLGMGMGTKEEPSTFVDEFNPTSRQPRPPGSVRAWRYQQGRRLWTQGSRPRCLCRFFCCTVFIMLFIVAAIVLALTLWIRPPNIIVGTGVNGTSPAVAQGVNLLNEGFQINMDVPIEVINPNYFSVKLTHVNAQIFYPINNTLVGNGTVNNVKLPSSSTTNFTFPFALIYTTSIDPTFDIITDIASKCLASPPADLTIHYKLTVGVRVFFVTISPTISNSLSFSCPIEASELEGIIKSLGINAGSGSGSGS